jgi:hypothetical protein
MTARALVIAFSVSALLWLGAPLASAASADLARCATIAAPDARLACYDQLAGRPADAGTPTTGLMPGKPVSANAAPATAPTAQEFGLTQAQAHPAPRGPDAIEAHVAGISTAATGHASVTLDNGQSWFVTDEDSLVLTTGDRVTIRRAALGSFLMTTPSKRAYHVRRTR